MYGRYIATALSVLTVAAMPVKADESGKFSKIDDLMRNAGMVQSPAIVTGQQKNTAKVDTGVAGASTAIAPEMVQLPATTVRNESFRDGVAVTNTPTADLFLPVEKKKEQASAQLSTTVPATTLPAQQAAPASKTVVVWGSGASSSGGSAQSGFVSEPGQQVGARTANNSPETLGVYFVEIPGSSVFEFSDDVSIPASKDGVLFANGVMISAVEQRGKDGVIQLMADRAVSASSGLGDCALMSDHSNLLMKGRPGHASKTFLEVDKLELLSRAPSDTLYSGVSPVIAKINFKPKVSKNANDASVNIWMLCTLPRDKWALPKSYSLGEMSATLGHLFTFKLARVAEI